MFNGPPILPFKKLDLKFSKFYLFRIRIRLWPVSDPIFLLLLQTTREQRLFFLCCG